MRSVKTKIRHPCNLNYGFPEDRPSGAFGPSSGGPYNFGQSVSKEVSGFMNKDENFPEETRDGYDLNILSLNNF